MRRCVTRVGQGRWHNFARIPQHISRKEHLRQSFSTSSNRLEGNLGFQSLPASSSVGPTFVNDSTIYALSTASGKAGIAIVRISGSACLDVYRALCPSKSVPRPRYASLRTLYDPINVLNILDSDALVLYFPNPGTVTGEEMLELHIHGGSATVKAVLAAISRCGTNSHIRYAETGEFTRRAFLNNRLDLAQVEALSDTLSAETEQQRRAAVRGNSGSLGRTYESWRHKLLDARGELEAIIDFSEDQDFDIANNELLGNVTRGVLDILHSVKAHEVDSRCVELLRNGIRISMLGAPNAGKSSLLNRIVGREASIVSTEAGTTRDVIEVSLDIEGYLCTFADTAGLRTSSKSNFHVDAPKNYIGKVEEEGIRRAKAKAKDSDVIIILASIEPSGCELGWTIEYDLESLQIGAEAMKCIIVVNKVDVVSPQILEVLLDTFTKSMGSQVTELKSRSFIPISCLGNQNGPGSGNIKQLMEHLVESFAEMTMIEDEDLMGVTERQRQLLSECCDHLEDYRNILPKNEEDKDCDIVLAAEHLRFAANCLSRITGRGDAGDVEQVLGVVFEKFCVGK